MTIIENNGKLEEDIGERMGKLGKSFNMMKNTFLNKR